MPIKAITDFAGQRSKTQESRLASNNPSSYPYGPVQDPTRFSATWSDTQLCKSRVSSVRDHHSRHNKLVPHVSLLSTAGLLQSVHYPLHRLG